MWTVQSEAQMSAVGELLDAQSERVITILVGAILEDVLTNCLRGRMRNDPEQFDNQFGPEAPSRQIAAKNRLAYLLKIYETDVYRAVSGIATIRNHFAHGLEVSFDDESKVLRKAWARLSLHVDRAHYPATAPGQPLMEMHAVTDRRRQFIINFRIVCHLLMWDAYLHFPHSCESLPDALRGKSPRILTPSNQDRETSGPDATPHGPQTPSPGSQ